MKHKLTNLDNSQIMRYSYDEENQSQRVTITNAEFGDALKEAFAKIELPKIEIATAPTFTPSEQPVQQTIYVDKIIKEVHPFVVEKNIFIPEIQVIEKPFIIKDIQIVKIPEYITIHQTEVIEKPIIIKEYEKIPNLLKYGVYLLMCLEFINLIKSLMK